MALTKQSDSKVIYLQVKHYSLWRELKTPVEGCEEVEVQNPKTKQVIKKYGYSFRTLAGLAVKLVKYDTEKKYQTRYFGFKLHVTDGTETYVLDMPYHSQVLKRFLRVAHNIKWDQAFSITIFKGKKKEGGGFEETGIWFQQNGETVKSYYTKEQPHGMPAATQDRDTHEWDFKAQHRWLVDKLKDETMPDIEEAAKRVAPPIEPEANGLHEHPDDPGPEPEGVKQWGEFIGDDDVPF